MKITGWLCALALSAGMSSMSFGQIAGKVNVAGKIPVMTEIVAIKNDPNCAKQHKNAVFDDKIISSDTGDLGNVVVYIKTPEGKTPVGKPLTKPAELDQVGCMYVPHVVAMTVGQPFTVKNSDPFLHNIHSLSFDLPAFNIGMPNVGVKNIEPYKGVEAFKIKCDVHPWMFAMVVVVDNPYFAITGTDAKSMGKYSIDTKDLPDGEYNLVAWHEVFGESAPLKVKVTGGKAEANFTYDAAKKPAQALPFKQIHLASANAPACCEPKNAK